jgi:hypothetical protein
VSRIDDYRVKLRGLTDWEPYLREQSGLPGPRGNLELAHAVALEGGGAQFLRWSSLTPEVAPENTPDAFLAFCGVLGLGALLARPQWQPGEGEETSPLQSVVTVLQRLRTLASDPRWRIREAVATGLQLWGDSDLRGLIGEMDGWAGGNYYEQRTAAAALCEPRLLKDESAAVATLEILDRIMQGVAGALAVDRKSPPFRTLRQALGYCWSVAVAAHPQAGVPAFERWLTHPDLDVRWIMRENLGKKRLAGLSVQVPPPE